MIQAVQSHTPSPAVCYELQPLTHTAQLSQGAVTQWSTGSWAVQKVEVERVVVQDYRTTDLSDFFSSQSQDLAK